MLIKNLIVNGCSFTYETPESWASHLRWHLDVPFYRNLAFSGAGNIYICDSTIEFLESNDFVPEDTLVVVMWSGVGRQDYRISKEWYDYFMEHYGFASDFVKDSYYLFSGGRAAGWLNNRDTKQAFEDFYRVVDEKSLCKESLLHFISLENYLTAKGYNFKFTSYFDYWKERSINEISSDSCIPFHCKDDPLYNNYDRKHWIDVECLGDWTWQNNLMDNTQHPTREGHNHWLYQIALSNLINDIHM